MTLTHDQLATLVPELLLCGHLTDRVTMPHILGSWDRPTMADVAIDEWMGASPIYTRRIQKLLGFAGNDDVASIFKAMQFDIGAPPQFMDFRYTIHDADHGEFHLDHCGALMDVEPMGDEYVFAMCHDIEDPTFDATAWATNPRARMRPIHRPPRAPADRHPHCAWTVTIDRDASPLAEPEMAALMRETKAAQLPIPTLSSGLEASDGSNDYAGDLVADIDFAAFSTATLAALAEEVSLQSHLLALAGLASIAGRFGADAARSIGLHQLIGAAGITAERLVAALGIGASLNDVAELFSVHPLFQPKTYVANTVVVDGDELHINLQHCPGLDEAPHLSWPMLLVDDPTPIAVIAQAANPCMTAEAVAPRPGAAASWTVRVEPTPARQHPDVGFANFSTGAGFAFSDEGTRVELRARRDRPTDQPALA